MLLFSAMMLRSSIVAVIMLLSSVCTAHNCVCHNLPPGFSKLSRGVDITKFDLRSSVASANNGLKKPVIDLTCLLDLKWTRPDGKVYQNADQFAFIMTNPTSSHSTDVHIYKSSQEFRDQLSNEVGVKGFLGRFGFSVGVSYTTIRHTITNTNRFVSEAFYNIGVYDAEFNTDVFPNKEVIQFFKDMSFEKKTYETNPGEYHRFIAKYGTHYIDSARFGGYLNLRIETNHSYFFTHTNKEYELNAKIALFNTFPIGGVGGPKTTSVDKTFKSKSKMTRYCKGGSLNSFNQNDFASWQETVEDDPGLLAVKLKPITHLIYDTATRNGIAAATVEHVSRSHLKELKDMVDLQVEKLGRLAKLLDFKSSLSWLEALPLGRFDQSEFEKLAVDIDWHVNVPEWFLTGTKLCLKWSDYGVSGQCGGSDVESLLCENVGSMTPLYMDNTDDREGGCEMQWAIQSHGYDPWFEDVLICYRWKSDGQRGQCSGEMSCVSVNKFTTPYRDNTDHRLGGCQMSWKLTVPEDAPIWMKTTQLCFNFLTDGDGDQCRPVKPGVNMCVSANEWTPYYVDDTDQRKGACFLTWGIKPCCTENVVTRKARKLPSKNCTTVKTVSNVSTFFLTLFMYLLIVNQ